MGHEKCTNVIRRQTAPQEQDGTDEGNGDWIELQTGPGSMDGIVPVTEAGASVIFCLKPEAPYTESTLICINSSRLMSVKLGVAGAFWASTTIGESRTDMCGFDMRILSFQCRTTNYLLRRNQHRP